MISGNCFIAMAGLAELVRDSALIRSLWNPTYRAWFPKGKADGDVIAIRVIVARIDYWEPPSNRVIRLAQAVKAMLAGRTVDTPMRSLAGL